MEQKKIDRKSLPDITTLESCVEDVDDVVELLTEGAKIKAQIGKKPDHAKGKEGEGLLARLDGITEELSQLQFKYNLSGLRFGKLCFVANMQDGRESLDKAALKLALLANFASVCKKGTDVVALINQAFEVATKTGDPFLVRELEVLD